MRKGLLGLAPVLNLLVRGCASAASSRTITTVTPPAPTIAAEQQAATLCAEGDRLRVDGSDDDARAAYEKALAQAWDAPCVPNGLDHVAHGPLVRAGGAVVALLPTLLIALAAAAIATALLRRLRADVLAPVTWSPRAFYDLACFGSLAAERRIPERDLRRLANLPSPRQGSRTNGAPPLPVHPGLWGLQQALRLSHGHERALLAARARRDPTLAPLLCEPVLGKDAEAALARYAIQPAGKA